MHSRSSPSQSNPSVSSAAESIFVEESHSQANVPGLSVEETSQKESEGFGLEFEEVFYATQSSECFLPELEEKNVKLSGAETLLKESTVAEIPLENSIDIKDRSRSEEEEKIFLPIASELKEATSDAKNIPTIDERLHNILKRVDSDSLESNMEQVRSLVEQKANVEIENHNSLTPFLQLITDAAPIEVVKKFVEIAKPNLLATNSKGENALHIAMINKKIDYMEYLLEKAPQLVKQRNHNDKTPLHYALRNSLSVTNYYAWIFEKYENDVLALDDSNDTPLYLMLVNNVGRFIEYNFRRCLKGEIPRNLYCDEIEKAVQVLPGLKGSSEDSIIAQITELLGKWVDLKSKLTIDEYQARSKIGVETIQEQKSDSKPSPQLNLRPEPKPEIIMPSLAALASHHYSDPKFQPIVDSLIYFAVEHDRTKLLKELLPSCKDATELNPFVVRALEIVLRYGRLDTLKIFIDSYANPTVKNQIIKFTLHTLMKANSPEYLLRFILDDDVEKIKKLKDTNIYTDFVFLLAAAVDKHGISSVNKLVSEILASNAEIKFLPDLLSWGIQLYKGLSVEDQKEDKEYSTFLSIIKNESITTDTWEETKVKIQKLKKSSFSRASDRPLESVKKSFEEKSDIVKIPLDKAEVEYVTNQYSIIKSYEEKLTYEKNSDLQAELHQCALKLRRNPNDDESKLRLIAMLSEYMRIVYGVVPHDTQMVNLLALLNAPHLINRRLAQIKSGEGKSLLIALLSAYSALAHGDPNDVKKSEKVDIITASSDLAVRDTEHYAPYYQILGLESGHNTYSKGKAEIPSGSGISEANILYGTSSSFIHHHLQLQIGSSNERRNLDTVIVDEFDNSILDDLTNFVIGFSNPACLEEVVKEVLLFMDGEAKEKNVDALKKHLKSTFDLSFPDEFINSWISAYRVLPKKKLGESYVNENGAIKIVNYENSGELLHGSRWSDFLHCFLELRSGVPFNPDSLSHAEMSFIYYINKYKRVYGMTGTLGNETERKAIEALLQTDQTDSKQKIYYDSPTHLPCQIKLDEKGHILTDDKGHDDAIINAVIEKINQGRPVHLICETIKETNRLYQLLLKKIGTNKNNIQIYNDIQKAMPDEILAAAGKPGAITITTNIGGRGSNIVVSPEVAKRGGLHVISTYLPHSKRIEEQNFMRTARHGQPGTYQYIVPLSEFSKFGIEYKNKSRETLFRELETARELHAAATLNTELYRKQISDIVYRVQEIFFDLPAEFKHDLEDIWKEAITDILRIARKYYFKDALDPKNIANAEQEITGRIEKFWQGSRISEWGGSAVYASPRHFVEHKNKSATVDLFARQMKESKETNSASSLSFFDSSKPDIKGFIADMDHTCLGIHTSGIALSTNPEDLRRNFKGPPEVLIKLLKSLHEKGIPIGIATFGTEIELVNADGVPYKPLFASGKKSVENHFAALLGENWSEIINNIQAYQVEDKKIIHKIRHVLSYSEYVSLSKVVAACRDTITEINNREKDESIQKTLVQTVYDKLNTVLDGFKKPTFDKADLEDKKVLPYGKNPHLAQFKRELDLDAKGVDNSQIIFSEDDYKNRALARYARYQVVENVAKRDGLAWVAEVEKKIPSKKALTDLNDAISRNYLASIGINV